MKLLSALAPIAFLNLIQLTVIPFLPTAWSANAADKGLLEIKLFLFGSDNSTMLKDVVTPLRDPEMLKAGL
uniref:Uncharacterized protein n=1 Tax=Parascaris univalens TaxID=6257 RepID=A0A915BL99_PARUN